MKEKKISIKTSIESLWSGNSNEHPQILFVWRNDELYFDNHLIAHYLFFYSEALF